MKLENTMDYREYDAKIVDVVDGDTVKVYIDLGFGIHFVDKLRFLDFDAPETWRPKSKGEKEKGEMVKEWLQKKISGRTIQLRTYKRTRGKYGRILARIFIEGEDLIQTMIDKGFEK